MRSSTCAVFGLAVLVIFSIYDASAMYVPSSSNLGFHHRSALPTRRLSSGADLNTLVARRQLQLLMMWSHKSQAEVGSEVMRYAFSLLRHRAPMFMVVAPFIKDRARRKVVVKRLMVAGRVMRRRLISTRVRHYPRTVGPLDVAPTSRIIELDLPNKRDSESSGSGFADDVAAAVTKLIPVDDEDSVDDDDEESSGTEATFVEVPYLGMPRATSAGFEASGSGSGDTESSETIDDEDSFTDEEKEEEEKFESGSYESEDSSTSATEKVPETITTSVAASEPSVRPTITVTTTLADLSDDEDFAADRLPEEAEWSSGDESSGSGDQSGNDEPGSAWEDEPPPTTTTTAAPRHVTQSGRDDLHIQTESPRSESFDPDFDLVDMEEERRSENFGVLPEEDEALPPSEEVEGPEDGPVQEKQQMTLDDKTLDSDEDMPLPESDLFGRRASSAVQKPELYDYFLE